MVKIDRRGGGGPGGSKNCSLGIYQNNKIFKYNVYFVVHLGDNPLYDMGRSVGNKVILIVYIQ